ncbi:FMN-binding protein [Alkaliphilus sp. B6464]|uniref:FMN-binding protein n=1 Tax=Alkaliphilus sp. B6464 TaxID=2731219 RepID=UPI001BA4F12B|nr:FMN-binding protein [Alkaliphilus sp. B6464]QUH19666.1 FMN-binding protein [Alkaliphilus sp. B6464]
MDKQQKIALILMPILAIGILAGGMFMSGKANPASAATYTDGVYEGEGEGFAGAIKVKVAVEGGKIASIELLEHGETEGIGDKGAEAVIASIIAEQKTDVDVSSGATLSSNGVMEAVKNALAGAGGSQSFTDGEFEGEAEGFHGVLKLKVKVDSGKITSIELLEHGETEGIGDVGAQEVIDRIIAEQKTDVDVSTGATFSSNAVMEAVKNALAGGTGGAEETAEEIEFIDGVYEGAAEGFHGNIKVKVEVKDGKLVIVEVLEQDETEGIGDVALEELSETMVTEQNIEIDNVSGATYSSKGIKEAVKNALLSAGSAEAVEAVEEIEFVDGVYEGAAEGFHGDVKVKVEVKDGKLAKVEVLEQSETEGIGDVALEELANTMVEKQTVEVDDVSGATFSSTGIKEAVKSALKGTSK